MLLTELILSKRGPLAKVWLSAHHEKKLSKQQALGVDVGESVGTSVKTLENHKQGKADLIDRGDFRAGGWTGHTTSVWTIDAGCHANLFKKGTISFRGLQRDKREHY